VCACGSRVDTTGSPKRTKQSPEQTAKAYQTINSAFQLLQETFESAGLTKSLVAKSTAAPQATVAIAAAASAAAASSFAVAVAVREDGFDSIAPSSRPASAMSGVSIDLAPNVAIEDPVEAEFAVRVFCSWHVRCRGEDGGCCA
jgi:hypothetical protein